MKIFNSNQTFSRYDYFLGQALNNLSAKRLCYNRVFYIGSRAILKYKHIFTLTVCISFISSCNKINTRNNNDLNSWQQVSSWSFKGKLAINDGNNSGSGRINWQVTDYATKAQFTAPLGQGSWEIYESTNSAVLTSSINGETKARNAKILLNNELGWDFPWDKLKFWLLGFKSGSELKKHQLTPTILADSGWEIIYQKWMATPIGLLPKKIKASKPPYSVKIIIYHWEIN